MKHAILTSSLPAIKKTYELNQGSILIPIVEGNEPLIKDITDKLISSVGREVEFYKNEVLPALQRGMTQIKGRLEDTVRIDDAYPLLVPFEVPSFVDHMVASGDLDNQKMMTFREITLTIPSNPDFSKYITQLKDDGLEGEVKAYLAKQTTSKLLDVYRDFIIGSIVDPKIYRSLSLISNFKELYIVFCLAYALYGKEAIEGATGSLDDYTYFLGLLIANTKVFISNHMKTYEKASAREMVALPPYGRLMNDSTVVLSPEMVEKFYTNGGTIETLYGMAKINDFVNPDIPQLLEKRELLEDAWNQYLTTFQVNARDRAEKALLDIYNSWLPRLSSRFSKYDGVTYDTYKKHLTQMSIGQFMDISYVLETYLLDNVLKKTNARLFVDSFKFYAKELDNKTAARVAMLDLVTTYLTSQLTATPYSVN